MLCVYVCVFRVWLIAVMYSSVNLVLLACLVCLYRMLERCCCGWAMHCIPVVKKKTLLLQITFAFVRTRGAKECTYPRSSFNNTQEFQKEKNEKPKNEVISLNVKFSH